MQTMKCEVAVICINHSGEEDVVLKEFEATDEEVSDGEHYTKAISLVEDDEHHGPFFAIDASGVPALIERLQRVVIKKSGGSHGPG